MKRNRSRWFVVFAVLMGVGLLAQMQLDYFRAGAQVAEDPRLHVIVRDFRVTNGNMAHVVEALRGQGSRVCFEKASPGVKGFLEDFTSLGVKGKADSAERLISLQLQDQPLKQVLDEVVRLDSDYRWEIVGDTSVINILPKQSALDFEIQGIDIKQEWIADVFDLPALVERKVMLQFAHKAERSNHHLSRRVTLKAERLRFRDFLNQICCQHSDLCWSVGVTPNGPIIVAIRPRTFETSSGYRAETDYDRAMQEQLLAISASHANLPQPEQSLRLKLVRMVHCILYENLGGLLAHFHDVSVRDGKRDISRKELRKMFQRLFDENDYQQFTINDVIDADKIQFEPLNDGRYRLSVPTKVKTTDGKMYFDDTLWFIFKDNKVVEFD